MKAALCKSLDGPGALVIDDISSAAPGPGQALVRVEAVSLNFFDTLITRGKYQHKPELPFSPGGEVAGRIAALGPGVTDLVAGQRVMAYLGWGGAREEIVVEADRLVPLPESVSADVASGLAITYGTAIHGLRDRGRLRPGETVAVLGAAGGAGLAAVEIARLMGARVIAVASSDDKLCIARDHGAELGLDYTKTDLKQGLRDLTGGKGVDVVYDCVGGDSAEPALRSMAWGGRYLVVGFAAGEIPRIPLNLLLVKGCEMVGVFWGESVKRDPAGHRRNMEDVLAWVAAGKLAPRIHAHYPLSEIKSAIGVLDRREATGKVVIVL